MKLALVTLAGAALLAAGAAQAQGAEDLLKKHACTACHANDKKLESLEFVSTSVRNDVTGLTTKIYNIKTSLFEQTNEVSSVKATQNQMQVCQLCVFL